MRRICIPVFLGWLALTGVPQAIGAESGAASSGAAPPAATTPDAAPPAATAPPDAAPAGTVDVKELMVPGPLGEEALGDPKAPVTVVEYVSMTCPHCARVHKTTFQTLKSKYIDTGRVYFVLREFPLDPLALAAIILARCAPPEKFFPIVDVLFELQDTWAFVDDPGTALVKILQPMGFTNDSVKACLGNQKLLDGVNWVHNRGEKNFGINGTPTFFFNGQRQMGELTSEDVDKIIAPMLPESLRIRGG
jgi:protein-disulfide isomerase